MALTSAFAPGDHPLTPYSHGPREYEPDHTVSDRAGIARLKRSRTFRSMTTTHPAAQLPPMLTIRHLQDLFQVGRTTAYAITARDDFPTAVALSEGCLRWWAPEVLEFAEAQRRSRKVRRSRARHEKTPTAEAVVHDVPQPRAKKTRRSHR